LISSINFIDLTSNDLISADTYNESKVLKVYLDLPKDGQVLVYKAAIQLAIVGFGNKNYGSVRVSDSETMSLKNLFEKYNIKYNEKLSAKYNDSELSARRLIRLFRCQIQEFIKKSKRPSYLWLKYSDKNQKFMDICFPGAEHLVEDKESALYLLKTYMKLDEIIKSKFVERLKRVYIARNLFQPLEIEQIIKSLSVPIQ